APPASEAPAESKVVEPPTVKTPSTPVPPVAPTVQPPPPPAPPTPEAPPPVFNPDGSVLFTPLPAVCLAGQPTRLYPPCGEVRREDLVINPGRSVGLIERGKPISASTMCRYGYAADIQGQYVAWWPSSQFADLDAAREEVGAILAEGCEGSWSAGLVKLSDGLPDSVRITDPRFRTRKGVGVGTGIAPAQQQYPGGAMQDNLMEGGIIYEKDGVSMYADDLAGMIREVWVWL
ncbi:MAG: hypothetical protein ACI8RZ_006332, partial [Myxococcota bacterium]